MDATGQDVGTPAGPVLRPMTPADLDRVLAVEVRAYSFPWSRGNFSDSLAAGYLAELLLQADDTVIGYYLALPGVDELHLLNLTVDPAHQGRGWGHRLMDRFEQRARDDGLASLWLEVRAGNAPARALYRHRGYAEAGLRRGYYPAAGSKREDAVVMSRRLESVRAAPAGATVGT
jgi:ribosomal-protein-alanine N-acetyltransferase